jgi:hypothetical protein
MALPSDIDGFEKYPLQTGRLHNESLMDPMQSMIHRSRGCMTESPCCTHGRKLVWC